MPWCHKCNTEYREGFAKCAECGEFLQENPPETQLYIRKDEPIYANPRFLVSLSGSIEADRVSAILESEGIQVQGSYRGAGQYLRVARGYTSEEITLAVPEEQLERARQILEEIGLNDEGAMLPELEEAFFAETPEEELERITRDSRGKKAGRVYSLIVVAFFALWGIAAVVMAIGVLYSVFREMLS